MLKENEVAILHIQPLILKILILFLTISIPVAAQTERYDLITYTAPDGWTKKFDESRITYSISNKAGHWCRMTIYKSIASRGSVALDFKNDWQDLVANSFSIPSRPDSIALPAPPGWERKSKGAIWEMDQQKSSVILSTMTGFGKEISMVVLTNTTDFNKQIASFLNDFILHQPETAPTAIPTNTRPVGTWSKQERTIGVEESGYVRKQYTFDADGTYFFYSKIYSSKDTMIFLTRESGRWILRGDNLTVSPTKSNLELWSKKNHTDQYGDHMNARPLALEKTTYQFTLRYMDDQKQPSLILKAKTKTQRDGKFSDPRFVPDAWIYRPIGLSNPKVDLPD